MLLINDKQSENLIYDEGYYFGRALFETILVKERALFLEEHLERLNKGLNEFKIDKIISKKYIDDIISSYNIKNQILKIIVSQRNVIITTRDIPYTKEVYSNGFSIKISEVRRNSTSILSYLKSVNYIENILEKEKAKELGFDEMIFLNEKSEICEGTSSNIFFIKEAKIYTPKVQCGLLDGIVRRWVINNFHVEEGTYSFSHITDADEIFLTNSIMGIMKVSCLENKKINSDYITKVVLEKYNKFIND